jgi:pyruvate formate-lyase/glycerol dehydratase family glycyl radical enzyme
MSLNKRIEHLRDRILNSRPSLNIERARLITQTYRECEGQPMVTVRGRAMSKLLTELPIDIAPGELIVGSPTVEPRAAQVFPEIQAGWIDQELDIISTRDWDPLYLSQEDKKELREDILPFWKGKTISERVYWDCPPDTARFIYLDPSQYPTQPTGLIDNFSLIQKGIGTTVPNYEKVLKSGIKGILEQVDKATSELDLTDPGNTPRLQFLKAARLALEGLVKLADRYSLLAANMAEKEIDPARRSELHQISEICSRVPYNPPDNFWEALQSFWFVHLAVRIEESGHSLSPGRFDQYMFPYYQMERKEGKRERPLELLECMFLKFCELMLFSSTDTAKFYTGAPQWQNLNLGGRNPEGRDATNELSFLCVEAMADLMVVQPDVSVRIHHDTPNDFLVKSCELARLGTGHPKFYNEDLIAFSMGCKGLSLEESRNFAIMGCVEPRAQGEGIHLTGGFINLPAALELALNDGIWRFGGKRIGPSTGDLRKFSSFDEVMNAFRQQLANMVRHMFIVNALAENAYSELLSTPFLSAITDDCIKRGRDLQHGGARHNFGPAVNEIGIADTADSLIAIKKLVFEEKGISMDELLSALGDNFEGHDLVRARLLHKAPKFGNDIDEVDLLAREIVQFCNEEVSNYRNIFGGQAQAGIIAVTAGIPFGKVVGALPSGRKACEPLADNASPYPGNAKKGPTATLRSVAKLDAARLRNGVLLNMRLAPDSVRSPEGLNKMAGLIRGLCDIGCWHVQFNVADTAVLKDAQKHPEKYPDLLVRVAGYSAYFTQLNKEVQEEIIQRTEYGL